MGEERSRKAMALASARGQVDHVWTTCGPRVDDVCDVSMAEEQSMLDAKLQETGEKERLKECPRGEPFGIL